jgi:hypothetical protein
MSRTGNRRKDSTSLAALLVGERVGAACTGGLDVELLQDLDRERDVPGGEDVVGAGGVVLLLAST